MFRMKKNYVIIITFVLSTLVSNVKSQSGNYQYWNDSALTWTDFYETPPAAAVDSNLSNFEYRIGVQYEKNKTSDTTLIHSKVYAYMFKKHSWVKEEAKSPTFLAYHQLLLEMLEVYRRKIQLVYYTIDDPYITDSLYSENVRAFENQKAELTATYHTTPNKDSLIAAYQTEITNQLTTSNIDNSSNLSFSKLNYGINVSAGYLTFDNSLKEKFNNSPLLNIGLDFGNHKFRFGLGGTIGWNKVKTTFNDTREWKKDLNVGILAVELNAGYNLSFSKFTVRPFGGIMYFQLSQTGDLNATNGYVIGGGSLVTGIIADYKLSKKLNLIPGSLFYNRMYAEMDIRFKVSLIPMDYGVRYQSKTLLFTIGVSSLNKVVKLN